MEVFVGNPPPGLDDIQLEELIINALLKSQSRLLFWKRINNPDVAVTLCEKWIGKGIRRYFFVQIDPPSLAPLAIYRLNGQNLYGHRLVVREFYTRGYMHERRAIDWRSKPWDKEERRTTERRIIKAKNPETTSETADPGSEEKTD